MEKLILILTASLMFTLSARAMYETDACRAQTKTFRLDNNDTQIESFQIVNNEKVLVNVGKNQNPLEVDCKKFDAPKTGEYWSVAKEKGIGGKVKDFISGSNELDLKIPSEGLVVTKVNVSDNGKGLRTIELSDAFDPRATVRIECGTGGFQIYSKGRSSFVNMIYQNLNPTLTLKEEPAAETAKLASAPAEDKKPEPLKPARVVGTPFFPEHTVAGKVAAGTLAPTKISDKLEKPTPTPAPKGDDTCRTNFAIDVKSGKFQIVTDAAPQKQMTTSDLKGGKK